VAATRWIARRGGVGVLVLALGGLLVGEEQCQDAISIADGLAPESGTLRIYNDADFIEPGDQAQGGGLSTPRWSP